MFLSESASIPHRLEKAKGTFETQRLGNLSGLVGMMQAARFLPSSSSFAHMEAPIGWLQPLRPGLHSPRGPGALTPGRADVDCMDVLWMGSGLGWAGLLVGLLELLRYTRFGIQNVVEERASGLV